MKHLFFDLDGTLLPMDQDIFVKGYFGGLTKYFSTKGYDADVFMNALHTAVYKMFENDGSRTNETMFFEYFLPLINATRESVEPLFLDFYTNYFPQIIENTCGYNEKSGKLIKALKDKGYEIYILTNPLFPPVATQTRIKRAGIDLVDVKYVTTYDNSSFTKPNPKYFAEVMHKFNIDSKDVMMVGNDTREDMAALAVGVDCYIIEDDLINRDNVSLENVKHGSFDDFMVYMNVE